MFRICLCFSLCKDKNLNKSAEEIHESPEEIFPRLKLPDYDLHFAYNMSHRHRGAAIILNHKFYLNGRREIREGTEEDRDRLASVLKCFNFDVKVFNDLSTCEIMKELNAVARMDHTDADCLLVVIMTHGEVGSISSYDGEYKIKTVTKLFRDKFCPTLIGKPRMFFIQACRGKELDNGHPIGNFARKYDPSLRIGAPVDVSDANTFVEPTTGETENDSDVDEDEMVHNPPIYEDFLIVRSTMVDHLSFRSGNGSWFIQDLCNELEVNGSEFDILNLLSHVNLSVSERESRGPNINKKK